MKKLILAASFLVGLSTVTHAQIARRSPEQRAGHITKVLQKQLNLSQDQAAKINMAFITRATRIDSLKGNLFGDQKLNHLSARSIMLSTQKRVLAVLNNTQKQEFTAWMNMRKEKRMQKKEALNQKS